MADNGVAQGYGRGGVAVGGKGGFSKSGAYEFGAKSAGEYLSGGLASQYAQAASTLRSDIAGGANAANVGQLQAKKAAHGNIGKLRDIANANAVGEFLDFAGSKGRGSQATASQGLVTGETYAPESTAGFESASSFTPQQWHTSGNGGVPSKYGKQMAYALGAGAPTINAAIMAQATPEQFGAQGAVNYAEAAKGQTGSLYRKMQAEQSYVDQAKATGNTQGMFQAAAQAQVGAPLLNSAVGRKNTKFAQKAVEAQGKKIEATRQGLLAMTPAERYLQGVS